MNVADFEKFRQYGFDPAKLAHNAAVMEKRGQQSIGQQFRVGTRSVSTAGVITSVAFARYDFTRTGRSLKLIWKITMECGANRTVREFFVSAIPRG